MQFKASAERIQTESRSNASGLMERLAFYLRGRVVSLDFGIKLKERIERLQQLFANLLLAAALNQMHSH